MGPRAPGPPHVVSETPLGRARSRVLLGVVVATLIVLVSLASAVAVAIYSRPTPPARPSHPP